jgi:hypothetical protein
MPELSDLIGSCCWKVAPFREGNRMWLMDLYKAYVFCLLVGSFLAVVLNLLEGDQWLDKKDSHSPHMTLVRTTGETALDECLWFVFTTMHGVAFNDFNAHDVGGRLISMFISAFSYWFPIYMMSIIVLSQLPGEKAIGAFGVAERVFFAVLPSYTLLILATCAVGAMMGPYISDDEAGVATGNEWPSGIYWLWTVVHRQPFGDIWPDTPFGRLVTVPAAWISVMYMPYALALVAVRKPNQEQHEALLEYLRRRPEDALGRGYVMPAASVQTGAAREIALAQCPLTQGNA